MIYKKISIVIPTRNRSRTLGATVRSCLDSKSKNYEVLICNNCSDDDTLDILAEINDQRVKVVTTPKRYSMCDNWEFAIDQSSGDYVIVIGDDDAIMPGSIDYLLDLINRMESDIYYWNANVYSWPTNDMPARVLKTWTSENVESVVELSPIVDKTLRIGGLYYMQLPLLYHALVRRAIIDKIREQTGRVFHSTQPDIFLAYALPPLVPSMVFSKRVVTCYGNSSIIRQEDLSGFLESKLKLFQCEYGDYKINPHLPSDLPPHAVLIQDAILTAMDLFPDFYARRNFGYEAAYATAIRDYRFISSFRLLLMSRRLKALHPFSPLKFIFYTWLHLMASVRRYFRKKIARKKIRGIGIVPDNILDFVRSEQLLNEDIKTL